MSKAIVKIKERKKPRSKHASPPKVTLNTKTKLLEISDPRVQLFTQFYFDPKSDSFGSVRGSAILAGYEEGYADKLTSFAPEWLTTILRFYEDKHQRMVAKAERNLEEILDMDIMVQAMSAFGPVYEKEGKGKDAKKIPIFVRDSKILKIKADISKYTTERLYRKKYGNQSQTANIFNTFNLSPEQMKRVANEFTLTIPKDGE
jgi:hypothetical protein